jgi:hypothetical protein
MDAGKQAGAGAVTSDKVFDEIGVENAADSIHLDADDLPDAAHPEESGAEARVVKEHCEHVELELSEHAQPLMKIPHEDPQDASNPAHASESSPRGEGGHDGVPSSTGMSRFGRKRNVLNFARMIDPLAGRGQNAEAKEPRQSNATAHDDMQAASTQAMIEAVQKLVRRAGPPSASVIAAATNPNSDKFIGVRPKQMGFGAVIKKNHCEINLGTYESAEEAARAYDVAALMCQGERAKLNFIDSFEVVQQLDASAIRDFREQQASNMSTAAAAAARAMLAAPPVTPETADLSRPTSVGSMVTDLANRLPYAAVRDLDTVVWEVFMRKNATLASFAELGAELLWLSRQVRAAALQPGWEQRRASWEDACRCCVDGAAALAAAIEFECRGIDWDAVEALWQTEEPAPQAPAVDTAAPPGERAAGEEAPGDAAAHSETAAASRSAQASSGAAAAAEVPSGHEPTGGGALQDGAGASEELPRGASTFVEPPLWEEPAKPETDGGVPVAPETASEAVAAVASAESVALADGGGAAEEAGAGQVALDVLSAPRVKRRRLGEADDESVAEFLLVNWHLVAEEAAGPATPPAAGIGPTLELVRSEARRAASKAAAQAAGASSHHAAPPSSHHTRPAALHARGDLRSTPLPGKTPVARPLHAADAPYGRARGLTCRFCGKAFTHAPAHLQHERAHLQQQETRNPASRIFHGEPRGGHARPFPHAHAAKAPRPAGARQLLADSPPIHVPPTALAEAAALVAAFIAALPLSAVTEKEPAVLARLARLAAAFDSGGRAFQSLRFAARMLLPAVMTSAWRGRSHPPFPPSSNFTEPLPPSHLSGTLRCTSAAATPRRARRIAAPPLTGGRARARSRRRAGVGGRGGGDGDQARGREPRCVGRGARRARAATERGRGLGRDRADRRRGR